MYEQMTSTIESGSKRPLVQLKIDRDFWTSLLFTIVTFGFYSVYLYDSVSKDINVISERNGSKKTVRYVLIFLIMLITAILVIVNMMIGILKFTVEYGYEENIATLLSTLISCVIFPFFISIIITFIRLIWFHKISDKIGRQIKVRGIDCEFSAKTFWLWFVLGSMIIVGPFVYMYKMIETMNKLNQHYNING